MAVITGCFPNQSQAKAMLEVGVVEAEADILKADKSLIIVQHQLKCKCQAHHLICNIILKLAILIKTLINSR